MAFKTDIHQNSVTPNPDPDSLTLNTNTQHIKIQFLK